jgi:asparagine synthase (glutamine-hydrolysing)
LAEKHILRMAMKSELPGSIARRPKQPYRAPDSSSFFSDGKPLDYVRELLSPVRIRAAGIFDARAIGKLVAKCSSGRVLGFGDNMAFVGALSTMLLHEQFVVPARGPQPLC